MTPVSLSITNFGPFKETQTFRFPSEPGFYFLWGDNQEQPRLGANGAGKTKLLDALCWVIFGKTTRGLKAADAANWDEEKCANVSFEYLGDDGLSYQVVRTWKPNSWTLCEMHTGEVVDLAKDSNPLLADLKLDFTPFLNCVMMAQAQPMFLDLKAEAKAALFSEVMGLDRWLDYATKASRKASDWDVTCRKLEREIASLDGELKAIERGPHPKEAEDKWIEQQWKELDALSAEHAAMTKVYYAKVDQRKEATARVKAARVRYNSALEEASAHQKTCPKCGQSIKDEHSQEVTLRSRELSDAEAHERRCLGEEARIEQSLDRLEEDAERVEARKNPWRDMTDKVAAEQHRVILEKSRKLRLADDADTQFKINSYWVRGFKEIRLGLISETLQQLEIEVNSCVNALGLVGWELKFEVDRETKSGSIQRGFNVFVQSPHNTRLVPWEAWSGGESQRLRVATQQGLGNLIRSRTGTTFNVEFWDEPTQWMGGQGVNDLLNSLAQRAKEENRQIWIIDHRSLGYGNFDGSSGVIKTKDGWSKFDQSGLYISATREPDAQERRRTATTSGPPPDDVRSRARPTRTQRKEST